MKKRILKFIKKVTSIASVKMVFYAAALILVLLLYSGFPNWETMKPKLIELILSDGTVSVFFAALIALIFAEGVKMLEYHLEESSKITDNHHDIIRKYKGHNLPEDVDFIEIPDNKNLCYHKGLFMELHETHVKKENSPKKTEDAAVKRYLDKQILRLPSVNMFTNITGNTEIVFDDKDEMHKLPDFIIGNAMELMAAHKNSTSKNNNTIRLDDFTYENGRLCFHTRRSTYFYMLMTNRCMDYNFRDGYTLRKLYEYGTTIRDFSKSVFSNQIGINGLVLTTDGYVLVEKRDFRKTTWKDKFAQSISLAMKEVDFNFDQTKNENIADSDFSVPKFVMGTDYKFANDKLKKILLKTIGDNFGLLEKHVQPIELKKNFLGLARDLLEGGKPNIYFYVVADMDAKTLAEHIKGFSKSKKMKKEKLSSDYYLLPYDALKVDYNYVLELDRTDERCIRVRRNVAPFVSKWKDWKEQVNHKASSIFDKSYQKECGEALLVTLAYLEQCEKRIPELRGKEGR